MNMNDIMGYSSSEICELFHAIEKAKTHVDISVEEQKLSLSGEVFLDNHEVCELLRLSTRTLQDYRDKRLIAFYKLEGKILYKMSDIQKMLETNYYDAWK